MPGGVRDRNHSERIGTRSTGPGHGKEILRSMDVIALEVVLRMKRTATDSGEDSGLYVSFGTAES
jgi:hypothetical protein